MGKLIELKWRQKMKIVVATDSFKGCMTSKEAGECIKAAILETMDADVKVFPLADGGEGTVEALLLRKNGVKQEITVTGPLGDRIESYYGIVPEKNMAIMEMANVAGLTLVPEKSKNPMNTTTYGVGEMILDAAEKGCREFLIGIGGSGTNDGGLGMLSALGVKFTEADGAPAGIYGRDILGIAAVDISDMNPVLNECHFTIMSDVTNPLCGEMGSSAIFGPQKGATEKIIEKMDKGLSQYAEIIKRDTGSDCASMRGAGAAGGLGFAFLSFLNTSLIPGISYMLEALELDAEMENADIVITGEGKLDDQTLMGKAPAGVAALAKKHGARVLAFTGNLDVEANNNSKHKKEGMDAYFSICKCPITTEEAMVKEVALDNLKSSVIQVFNLINMFGK